MALSIDEKLSNLKPSATKAEVFIKSDKKEIKDQIDELRNNNEAGHLAVSYAVKLGLSDPRIENSSMAQVTADGELFNNPATQEVKGHRQLYFLGNRLL